MDLRQFFIHQSWWGKLFGACFGFLTAGPIGAVCGILVGNFFDKGLQDYFSKPYWHYLSEKNNNTKTLFVQALFSLLGHIAKNKGHITADDIRFAQGVMSEMELSTAEKKAAQLYFQHGKEAIFFQERARILITLKNALIFNRPLLQRLVNTLYQALELNANNTNDIRLMNQILSELGLSPMHKQRPGFTQVDPEFFYRTFKEHKASYAPPPTSTPLQMAYQELKITPAASMQEVKRAYRRLISKHHPDKLIAQGANDAAIKDANTQTQRIRKAYETICAAKNNS